MADSYQGFQGTNPSAIGSTATSGNGAIVYLSTMEISANVNNLILSPGNTTPTNVNIANLPVINSLVNRTTDVFYNGSNLTTIDGNFDVNLNLGVASNANINGNVDINGTLNVDGNITMPTAGQYIELNPANNTGWGNTFLNTNIYQGFKKGGGGFNLTAPEFVSYPTTFTVGGLLYPATLIELTSGILNINGVATTTITGATCAINAVATEIGGTLTVLGLTTFTGQQTMNGNTTVNGAMEATGTTTLTGAVFATGTNFTATTGTNTLTSGANTITAVGTNTITGGINLLTGGLNTYTALQHYFVGDIVDFTSVLTSTCKLRVDTIESSSGMELINVSSINGAVYPPPGSGGTVISTFNQLYTSSFKANTAQISSISSQQLYTSSFKANTAQISSISSQQLFVSSINGSVYPPVATQTISSFNTASISSLNVSSINNAVYPPPNTAPSLWANYPASSNVIVPGTYGIQTDKISAYTLPSPGQIQMLSPIIMGNNTIFTKNIDSTYSAGINLNINSEFTTLGYTVAGFSRPPTLNINNGFITNCSSITGVSSINGAVYPPPAGNVSAWATFSATSSINALTYGIQTGYIDATNAPLSPFNILGINNASVRFQNIRNGTPGSAPTLEFSDGSLNLMKTIAMTSNGAITNVSSINGVAYPPPPLVSHNYGYTLPLPGLTTYLFSATLFPTIVPTPLTNGYNMTFFDGFGGGGTIFLKNCLLAPSLIETNYSYSPSVNSPPTGLGIATFGQNIYFTNTSGGAFSPTFPTYAILTPVNYQ